ncbi:MAG: IS91 family transposase, partial [Syntrophomonas sp.]
MEDLWWGRIGCFESHRIVSRGSIFKMLKREGKIDDHIIENMLNWHHSGFNVYCGLAINPGDQ